MANKLAALYVRVSTDMQVEKGDSISNQLERLKSYCAENNLKYRVYEDSGISAKDINRPALSRLIKDIKSEKISTVLVTKIDRITRRMRDFIDLLTLFDEKEVYFKSLTQPIDTGTAMGRGFLNLLGVFAEMERGMISERVSEDKRQRAKNGTWNGGGIAYGYTSYSVLVKSYIAQGLTKQDAELKALKIAPEPRKLYIYEKEAEVVRMMYEKYKELESIRAVSVWLNDAGYTTRTGCQWWPNVVSRTLANPVYIGRLTWGKTTLSNATGKFKKIDESEWIKTQGEHQPIIDKATFEWAQKTLGRQRKAPRRKGNVYLLSGLVKCGKCGSRVCGYRQTNLSKNGEKEYSYYRCHRFVQCGKSACSLRSVSKEALEEIVLKNIVELVDNKGLSSDLIKKLNEQEKAHRKNSTPLKKKKLTLENRVRTIEKKKKNLLIALEDGVLAPVDYKERIQELAKQEEIMLKTIQDVEVSLNNVVVGGLNESIVYELLTNFKKNWKNFDDASKKTLIASLVSEIQLNDDEVKIQLFFIPGLMKTNKSLSFGSKSSGSCYQRVQNITPCFTYTISQPLLLLPEDVLKSDYIVDRLTVYRLRNNLSQEKIAHSIGISRGAVNAWEAGIKKPSKKLTKKVERFLLKEAV